MKYVIGVDLGGTNTRASVITSDGSIKGESRYDSKAAEGFDVTVGQIILAIESAVEKSGISLAEISGIGIGIPGTVKNAEGMVLWNPNFNGWDGVNIRKPLEAKFGKPIVMGNDANVAALGECVFGAGIGSKVMVMFTLGTGVGSGLVINGESFTGVSESAPEMGHQIILADGPRCGCGRSGCLEALASRDAICFRAAKKAHSGRKTTLLKRTNHDLRFITPAMIAEAASEGDEISIETLNETGYYIGIGISNIINILSPDKIVIGGGISQAGDLLFDSIRSTVEVNALHYPLQFCAIVPAKLGDDAGVFGAAALALGRV